MRAYEEPVIGGDRLPVSQAEFERSCKVLLWEEQNKLNPSNSLIAALCNAVRLSREYCAAIKMVALPEPIPTRAALLQALKEDLESFEYLNKCLDKPEKAYALRCCIDDAIARINDMLNAENARVMGEEKK